MVRNEAGAIDQGGRCWKLSSLIAAGFLIGCAAWSSSQDDDATVKNLSQRAHALKVDSPQKPQSMAAGATTNCRFDRIASASKTPLAATCDDDSKGDLVYLENQKPGTIKFYVRNGVKETRAKLNSPQHTVTDYYWASRWLMGMQTYNIDLRRDYELDNVEKTAKTTCGESAEKMPSSCDEQTIGALRELVDFLRKNAAASALLGNRGDIPNIWIETFEIPAASARYPAPQ
jgi:hypothetical protein